jgi:hypothetical protein
MERMTKGKDDYASLVGSRPQFEGRFSAAIRRRLTEKRLAMRLTYQQLGDFFHLNWSTWRKWEKGVTLTCHPKQVAMIEGFLNGDYDAPLTRRTRRINDLAEYWEHLPPMMHECMERISTTYALCEGRPELRTNLMNHLSGAADRAIMRLLESGK